MPIQYAAVTTNFFDVSTEGDLILRLHVQPGGGRTAVTGTFGDALKVKVAAPPTGGRANDACLEFIAELLGVGKDGVELTSGESSRSKRVRVRGVEADDARRLIDAALEEGNGGRRRGVRPS